MQSRCRSGRSSTSITFTLLAIAAMGIGCSSALPAICAPDNASYDGASLPPPAKKKASVSDDADSGSEPVKPRRRRRDDDSAPLPKVGDADNASKGKPVDAAGERKIGRPHMPGDHPAFGSFFGKGPLDLTPLALTDEQKQKIQQMRSDNAGKARELMRKRRELGGQMKDILFGPDSTDAQIKAKRDELRQVQEKLEDIRLDDMLAIRSVLTAEQKQKLRDLKVAEGPSAGPGLHPLGGPPVQPLGEDGFAPRRHAPPPPKDDVKAKVSQASNSAK